MSHRVLKKVYTREFQPKFEKFCRKVLYFVQKLNCGFVSDYVHCIMLVPKHLAGLGPSLVSRAMYQYQYQTIHCVANTFMRIAPWFLFVEIARTQKGSHTQGSEVQTARAFSQPIGAGTHLTPT